MARKLSKEVTLARDQLQPGYSEYKLYHGFVPILQEGAGICHACVHLSLAIGSLCVCVYVCV